jgi:hypothetical protein
MNADLPEDGTSSSLLADVRNGDAAAWIRLGRWIGPLILKWCRRAGLQPADNAAPRGRSGSVRARGSCPPGYTKIRRLLKALCFQCIVDI